MRKKQVKDMEKCYGVALDIGTTNLVMRLVDLKTGAEVITIKEVNRQCAYGADVITRIQAASEGKLWEMQVCIQRQIAEMLLQLLADTEEKTITQIVIVGNVTMCHLLRGYACEGLGRAPFTPVSIEMEKMCLSELLNTIDIQFSDLQRINAEVTIFPGIAAFIGGDIVAGIYACDMDKKDSIQMLVDVGTNGEMVLYDKKNFWVTSTAAGCAFENPFGITGSAFVELLAKLLREGIIDENGTFIEEYFEEGYFAKGLGGIQIKQSYIRALQLAKAAIRAGMEILSNREKPDIYYVAGVFGMALDIEASKEIGLFPSACEGKISAVGNTALEGACKYLLDENPEKRIEAIVQKSKEILLVNEPDFEEKYLDYMQVKY